MNASGDLSALGDLFPDGDFRFHLTIRRTEPRAFFAARDGSGRLLAERAKWLDAAPGRYAALRPEGEPLVEEFAAMARDWVTWNDAPREPALLQAIGRSFEPDVVFLARGPDGAFRLQAGALCFPTGWALEEKLGLPLDEIHGVVPGLNPALGPAIGLFLSRLKPGAAFLRDNWGIAGTDTLNLHPARRIPPPQPPVSLDRLWLRVEHQALVALPETRGVAFAIRIVLHRLDAVTGAGFGVQLRRALETMPPQLAAYKRIDTVIPELLRALH